MKRFAILLLVLLGNLWAVPVAVGGNGPALTQDSASTLTTLETDLSANGSTLFSIPMDLGSMDVGRWLVKAGLSPMGIHGWSARE